MKGREGGKKDGRKEGGDSGEVRVWRVAGCMCMCVCVCVRRVLVGNHVSLVAAVTRLEKQRCIKRTSGTKESDALPALTLLPGVSVLQFSVMSSSSGTHLALHTIFFRLQPNNQY